MNNYVIMYQFKRFISTKKKGGEGERFSLATFISRGKITTIKSTGHLEAGHKNNSSIKHGNKP